LSRINHADIARKLNLARITVTKALGNHSDIAPETRLRVRQMADELGYIPNLIGRNLARRSTSTLGVVVPKIAHSFFATAIEYFFEAATAQGFDLIPMVSFEDAARQQRSIEALLGMHVDGLIIDVASNTSEASVFEKVKKAGVPMVFFDRMLPDFPATAVICNDRQAARQATLFGISRGYTRVAHFAGSQTVSIGCERAAGYREAMEKYGLPAWTVPSGFTEEAGYASFLSVLAGNTLPELIFAVNDSVAQGIYRAAQEKGVSIPGDVGVIGFGDLDSSRLLTPPLTSLRLPVRQMAYETIRLLVARIKGEAMPANHLITFEAELVVRESTQ
jgi:LacI family transcriptional regulator